MLVLMVMSPWGTSSVPIHSLVPSVVNDDAALTFHRIRDAAGPSRSSMSTRSPLIATKFFSIPTSPPPMTLTTTGTSRAG